MLKPLLIPKYMLKAKRCLKKHVNAQKLVDAPKLANTHKDVEDAAINSKARPRRMHMTSW